MRSRSFLVCISLLLLTAVPPLAEQPKQNGSEPFYFVALTEPACPVAGFVPPVPVSKELRVLYFPMGQRAVITAPKSLFVHVVFDSGFGMLESKVFPLSKRDDGVWFATAPLKDMLPKYAVYWFEDRDTKQTDANGGNYFDIPFCDAYGNRDELSAIGEARSYTGALSAYGVDRATDYVKAIDILQSYIHPPLRGQNATQDLWQYKLKLNGDTPEARQKLLAEINQFIQDHAKDGFGLMSTMNFVAYHDWVPQETTDALIKALENKYPAYNGNVFLLQAKASSERDKDKRIALEWELVEKYPDSPYADNALKRLAMEVKDFSQRERLYKQLRAKQPEDPFQAYNLAMLYSEANKNLPEALSLVNEAEKLLESNQQNKQAKIHYLESSIQHAKLMFAVARGDLLLRLGRPAEAVAVLQEKKSQFESGRPYYLLGKALENNGDQRQALEAYLEAVVRPSDRDKEANAALDRLWKSQRMGSEQKLQQRIEEKLAQNFNAAEYVPQLQSHAAPDFELTTLRGERLSSSQLRGKAIVLNFWAPWCGACRPELKPLQDFQARHPEVIVATVVDDSTDAKDLSRIIRQKKLNTLRICEAPIPFHEKFNVTALPDTVVIDASGFVRVRHLGSIPDVERYLDADLKAIALAGPPKQLAQDAPK